MLSKYVQFFPRDYQCDTVTLLNLILFKAADSTRAIYEVAMQLLQVCKQSSFYNISCFKMNYSCVLANIILVLFRFIFQ